MRSINVIQKDIERTAHLLNVLILEKKLTIDQMLGIEASSKILAEKAIEKMMQDDCGK
jgi:hypothetical protein